MKIFLPFILLTLLFLLQSCTSDENTAEVTVHPYFHELWQEDSTARRFQESDPQGPTAIESALELSEKYAILSTEANVLRQQNKNFTLENQKLRDHLDAVQTQLQQTQKELKEANEIMISMRMELNNWKSDVLGFRKEMRNAEKAQLEALLKILKVLGGDVNIEVVQENKSNPAVASAK